MVEGRPTLEHASPAYLALAFASVAIYYLVFILGWIRILAAWGIEIPYRVALGAEMVSMLAKYIPGGVWTPAARAVALRRSAGVTETPTVLASVFVEAALSAISGVIVFVISLAWVKGVDAPLLPLIGFGVLCAAGLHPRIFRPLANKLLHPFGAEHIEPLPFGETLGLLLFYCGTWLIGGVGGLLHVAERRLEPGPRDDPVPRRRLGRRRDRGGGGVLLAVGNRRPRSVDVRPAARDHEREGRRWASRS